MCLALTLLVPGFITPVVLVLGVEDADQGTKSLPPLSPPNHWLSHPVFLAHGNRFLPILIYYPHKQMTPTLVHVHLKTLLRSARTPNQQIDVKMPFLPLFAISKNVCHFHNLKKNNLNGTVKNDSFLSFIFWGGHSVHWVHTVKMITLETRLHFSVLNCNSIAIQRLLAMGYSFCTVF